MSKIIIQLIICAKSPRIFDDIMDETFHLLQLWGSDFQGQLESLAKQIVQPVTRIGEFDVF